LPLRRTLSIDLLGLCLLAAGVGATGAHPPQARPAPTPRGTRAAGALGPAPTLRPAGPAAAGDAGTLLRAAAAYVKSPGALADQSTAFADEGAVELYHLDFEQVMPNGLSGKVVQRVFQMRTAAAAADFVPDDVWYDRSRTRFQLIRAQVLRHGRVLVGADRGDLRPGGTGNQPRQLSLPPLRAGDRLNLLYVLLPDTRHDWTLLGGHFLGNLFAFRDSYSTLRVRYVLAAPAAQVRDIATSQVGVPPPQLGRSRNGDRTWSWQARLQSAFFSSQDGPSITDLSPFVQVSGFSSWAAMADWYNNLLARRARLSGGLQQRLLQVALPRLAGAAPGLGARPPAEIRATVARVWSHLSAHLDYRGDESGIHAYVPAPVGEVYASGLGDCKDGALLLTAWLRAAGVEADLALVRTAAMGQIASPASNGQVAATISAFDHALVYIPATQQWIDTTAPAFLSTELPSSDQNSLALIVRAGQRQLVHVPMAAASANLTRRSLRFTDAGAGWLQAEGDIQVRGADAPLLRQRYTDPARRRQELALWLRSFFPQAQVDSVAIAGVEPSRSTVRLQFSARVPARELRPALRVAWSRRHYARLLAAQAERRQALQLPLRWQLDESWALQVGDSGACAQLGAQPPLRRDGPFGQLTISTSCAGGWLQVQSRLAQTSQQVAPADYSAFRSFWQRVDADLDTPLLNPERQSAQLAASPVAQRRLGAAGPQAGVSTSGTRGAAAQGPAPSKKQRSAGLGPRAPKPA